MSSESDSHLLSLPRHPNGSNGSDHIFKAAYSILIEWHTFYIANLLIEL